MAAGEFETFADAFYHSTVNYTTLGYGDIVMSLRWRLLGAAGSRERHSRVRLVDRCNRAVVIRLVRYRRRAQTRQESRP